jgi:hypothetical protein
LTHAARDYPALVRLLVERRVALGLSPADVDALASLPRRTTERIEIGARFFSARTMAPILRALRLRLIVRHVGSAT